MTYRTTRQWTLALAGGIAMIGALSTTSPTLLASPHPGAAPIHPSHHFWDDLNLDFVPGDAWERLRDNMEWHDRRQDARVQQWIEHYRSNPHNIAEIIERARPWMAWITEQVELRGLPGEVGLIPFVESSYDPLARSHRGAAGLWQFMPGTADALGLSRQRGYDARLDVIASTQAALDYIELQAEQWYEGDIELSLAAYNAGAGTVNRARHAAAASGAPDGYWHLQLPGETMNYLPKLNAIAAIIDDPDAYGVALPEIDDAPAFAKVPVNAPINLSQLASVAGVDQDELAALNPGLTNGSASPATVDVVLVPVEAEETILAELSAPASSTPADGERYLVQRGDSLSAIASRHGISVAELRRHNALAGDVIHAGQRLEIPRRSLAAR
ncbi:transglycosylase SLT domain-containing protein [Halomonas sp. MCCC 1A17488]|uniref:Transglycosylase SLT domain-containing protein n=1 Tax=Billgrantia sulfidoxydans TaxID=2733484 RepID=A0ABX7W4C6_9GAMM|nr:MULTISPECIES: transglycosylase SLT domain-containing protein [Halomonas]MCE8015180.1 transglycosylase SLT domain-containing protein [Halomonas sp. MCCC 1A17488]MCG3238513.1 transglycosylase SLT domain-containing protein [Halomonas sp. MCCC 1A17488]QPP47746.1 transglycosylase SLT domain-containing protein [Halomonas sp. SS10-MC5]QTP55053.1 transglycosylase SLT domain-containing protein [Halomonas sulfidoxydans]